MGQFEMVKDFFLGMGRSRISMLGALICTLTAPFLLGYMIADTLLHIANPYFGAAVYLLLGPAFLFGLALIFVGAFFFRGKHETHLFTLSYLGKYFSEPGMFNRMRKNVYLIVFLTSVNFVVFSLFLYRAYHYMESTAFCGQFCHTVMEPEFTAFQNSPHSRVGCVECHIGPGADWFVKSKISGARQLLAVVANTYPTPIETPVHGLRPARDTCEKCHRPELFHGDTLNVINRYESDEANTRVHDVMLMKIGSAGDSAKQSHGIHWHVAPENKITYLATDHSRMVIPEIRLSRQDGSEVVFRSEDAEEQLAGLNAEPREMDCIDCHNRPSHIYVPADKAIDQKILEGKIPQQVPYIKRQALEVVFGDYADANEAQEAIASKLSGWYKENYPDVSPELLAKAIAGTQQAYRENVFPLMKVNWDTYVNHVGHGEDFDIGCFRCHDDMHEDAEGNVISGDCNLCHTLLAEGEEDPEILKVLQTE